MANLIKTCFTLGIVMAFLFTASCTRNVKEMTLTNENATFTLVIAGDASEYKDSIREDVIAKYRAEARIEVINIEGLENLSEDSYDVILIMDTCIGWGTFNQSISHFLENTRRKDNIVLFITADDEEWEFSYQNVDAITSASEIENKETATALICERIDGMMGQLH